MYTAHWRVCSTSKIHSLYLKAGHPAKSQLLITHSLHENARTSTHEQTQIDVACRLQSNQLLPSHIDGAAL
jgi:hypothetical protein